MKNFFKNNIHWAAAVFFCIAVVAVLYVHNGFYGNPVSKASAEKNIKAYIVDTYEVTDFILTDVEYNREYGEYGTTVTFKNSKDIVFDVSYSVKETRITDNYDSVVANGYNTFIRLSSDYGNAVSDKLCEKYGSDVFVGYGELGKNQSLDQISAYLKPDMEFDMYNLPLEATVSVFFDRDDTSSLQFAKELTELQMLMYSNEIAVDYYDVMYNNSILLEDFPSHIVVENLEDIARLAEQVEIYMK